MIHTLSSVTILNKSLAEGLGQLVEGAFILKAELNKFAALETG